MNQSVALILSRLGPRLHAEIWLMLTLANITLGYLN